MTRLFNFFFRPFLIGMRRSGPVLSLVCCLTCPSDLRSQNNGPWKDFTEKWKADKFGCNDFRRDSYSRSNHNTWLINKTELTSYPKSKIIKLLGEPNKVKPGRLIYYIFNEDCDSILSSGYSLVISLDSGKVKSLDFKDIVKPKKILPDSNWAEFSRRWKEDNLAKNGFRKNSISEVQKYSFTNPSKERWSFTTINGVDFRGYSKEIILKIFGKPDIMRRGIDRDYLSYFEEEPWEEEGRTMADVIDIQISNGRVLRVGHGRDGIDK